MAKDIEIAQTNCFTVLFPGIWGAPIGGMPTGPLVYLDFARRVWAASLHLCVQTHFKKDFVLYLSSGGMENK